MVEYLIIYFLKYWYNNHSLVILHVFETSPFLYDRYVLVFLLQLQTYVTSTDKEFAAATIQAIGRCASNIAEITDTCLSGLVHLMSNRDGKVLFLCKSKSRVYGYMY